VGIGARAPLAHLLEDTKGGIHCQARQPEAWKWMIRITAKNLPLMALPMGLLVPLERLAWDKRLDTRFLE